MDVIVIGRIVIIRFLFLSLGGVLLARMATDGWRPILAQLLHPHGSIDTSCLHELFMAALFCNFPLLDDQDFVRVHDGGEPMCNHERRPVLGYGFDRILNLALRLRVL